MNRHPEKTNKSQHRRPMAVGDWFGLACLILFGVCSLILLVRLLTTKMLTSSLVLVLVIALVILNGLHLFVQLPRWKNLLPKFICGAVAILLSGAMIYTASAAGGVQAALQSLSGKLTEKETTYVIVMKDDPARDIGDMQSYRFGTLSHMDQKNTEALMKAIKDGLGKIKNTPYDNAVDLADSLYSKKVDAIALNEGYISMLEDVKGYEDFSQRTRIIYEFTTEHAQKPITPNSKITTDPFVVYCSGIDARNKNVNIKSLSDVNILAVVHPVSHQILLINTPRDYYVPLVSAPYAGMRDKLTHAGGIGIEESAKVLGQLYNVEASYYMRVNFLGLVDIVDALDGIDVNSDYTFSCHAMGPTTGYGDLTPYSFQKGINHMNGYEALAFCRERHSFSGGDNQRGKNQMSVISGIVDKVTSPEILTRYDELLEAVKDCVATNMPYEDISNLVQMQMRDKGDWNITSYAVTGRGDFQQCPTMGAYDLWVMWPNENDIDTAKNLIQQVMNGQEPVIPKADN